MSNSDGNIKNEFVSNSQPNHNPELDQLSCKLDPWSVIGKVDYNSIVDKFGVQIIDIELLEKFKRVTGKEPHLWLKRGIFFAHRSLNEFLDAYEQHKPIYLYTGRGPTSDSLHLGHILPLLFTKYLQDVFDCITVIQIADDEKFYFKDIPFDLVQQYGINNIKDIISLGFNPKKTYIYFNRDHRTQNPNYEFFASNIKKKIPIKTLQKIFGLDENCNLGQYDWTVYQTVPAFCEAFEGYLTKGSYYLIPYAIDQDPYFRMARDIASNMNPIKPSSIICKFLASLSSTDGKMSSSVNNSNTIFLSDNLQIIKNKINKHAFSGGGGNGSLEDHKKYGGNPDLDVCYQYLTYLLESDDELLALKEGFINGTVLCGDLKKLTIQKIFELLQPIQKLRSELTNELINEFSLFIQ
jgi:tryptophanyl-tRNA synthetase